MPLGAARITLLAFSPSVQAEAEVIRRKVGVSAVGNAQVDTAQSKFGGASYLGDGTGDYLLANNVDSNTFTGDFTIEGWYRFPDTSSQPHLMGIQGAGGTALPGISIWRDGSNIKIYSNGANGSWAQIGSTVGSVSTNTWYHIYVSRSGNNYYAGINGTSVSLGTFTGTISSNGNIVCGGLVYTSTSSYSGHIDEVRISNTARYTTTFTPSTTPFVNDDNTLLLLHMDGTDGSTYFEDDNGVKPSANRTAQTVTVLGNTQVDTAQSKFGGSSMETDTSGDYLDANGPLIPSTGDFTVEYWWRAKQSTNQRSQFGQGDTTNLDDLGVWSIANRAGIQVRLGSLGSNALNINAAFTFTADTWYHIALVRNGTSFNLYINGTSYGSGTTSQAISQDNFKFAANSTTGTSGWGWWDELRVSNTARYTANFTAPTAPFANDDNTLLLLHMDGADGSTTFTDDNLVYRRKVGFSAYNNAEISTDNSKFGGASMYTPGGTQMSTADYIEANLDHGIGTGDFTIEWWNKWETSAATNMFSLTDSSLNVGLEMRLDNPASWRVYKHESAGSTFGLILNSNNEIYAYSADWNHFAFVRQSGTIYLYVNGTKSSISASYTTDLTNATIMHIGAGIKSGYASMTGYMDEVRVSNTARYTSGFTPPTEAFTNDSDTVALLHMNGTDTSTDFLDDNGTGRSPVGVSAFGNAQVDTAQSKFGGASLLLDGSGDYLMANDALTSLTSTSDPFTLEAWVRQDLYNASAFWFAFNSGTGSAGNNLLIGPGNIYLDGSPLTYDSGAITTTNTWIHIAYTYDGSGTHKVYKDGILHDTTSHTPAAAPSGLDFGIGAEFDDVNGGSPGNYFDGYMDEIRLSNTVRYTANFTPATEPFANDANTLLLLHMDGTDTSTTFIDDNGTY